MYGMPRTQFPIVLAACLLACTSVTQMPPACPECPAPECPQSPSLERPSCPSTDCQAPTGADLQGVWSAGPRRTLLLDLRDDGTLLVQARNWTSRMAGPINGAASGRWQLEDGRFMGQIEASDLLFFPRGHTWSDEVVFVSDRDLILRNESGGIEAYQR